MALRLEEGLGILGQGVTAGVGAYRTERERLRELAEKRAATLRSFIDAETQGRQGERAMALQLPYTEAVNESTGLQLKPPPIVGTPTPGGGRDFNQLPTLNAMRAASGLGAIKPPPLMEVSPGASLVDPVTRRVAFQAPFKPDGGLTFDQRRQLDEEERRFKAQQGELDRNARRGAGGAGGVSPVQANAADRAWRSARESQVQRLTDAWVRSHTRTEGAGYEKITIPPQPKEIEAARNLLQREWESRNPPPALGGSGMPQGRGPVARPDPFANP